MVTVEAISGVPKGARNGQANKKISSAMLDKWRGRARLPMGRSGEEYLRMVRDGDLS
jgi:hypothetical protein